MAVSTISAKPTEKEAQEFNALLFEKLSSNREGASKEAAEMMDSYTRTQLREESAIRKIIPIVQADNNKLTRTLDGKMPIILEELEPSSPGAVTVGFSESPDNLWLNARRYQLNFNRMRTVRMMVDVDELRTWIMDLRQIFSDNLAKDLSAQEDANWLRAINVAIVGANTLVATSGTVQYKTTTGPVEQSGLVDMLKILPNTPGCFPTKTVLVNNITILDILKFDSNTYGFELAGEAFKDGWTRKQVMGVDWLITIKKQLVPTNNFYLFADPVAIGKYYYLYDVTMSVKKDDYFVKFFMYQSVAGGIGNTNGVGRFAFTG